MSDPAGERPPTLAERPRPAPGGLLLDPVPAAAPDPWRSVVAWARRRWDERPGWAADPVVLVAAAVAVLAALVLVLRPGPAGDGAPDAAAELPRAAAPAPVEEVVVHVAGAVHSPGVYRLGVFSRIVDAVEAAGGAVPGAQLHLLNLAAPVRDGDRVWVPREGEEPPPDAAGLAGAAGVAGATGGDGRVDLNRADAAALDALPGVGPATAEAILRYRDEHGPFTSVEQLLEVPGIGPAKLDGLRDLVRV